MEIDPAVWADLRQYVPTTLIYLPGGTRRAAALAGASSYTTWTLEQALRCFGMLFATGVRHIFTGLIFPTAWQELTPNYRSHLVQWAVDGAAGPTTCASYQHAGWRVRIVGAEMFGDPQLLEAAQRLRELPASPDAPTLWWQVAPSEQAIWGQLMTAAATCAQPAGRAEVATAIYGEPVPAAQMLLAFGKPLITSALVPPALIEGNLQCYWSQRPGYSLDEPTWREIVYDAGVLRNTWSEDKSDREASAIEQRALWEGGDVLGLGHRRGPYWLPGSASEDADPLA